MPFLISAIICLALLLSVYPWFTYYGNFYFGFGITILSYLLVAFCVGLLSAAVIAVLAYTKLPRWGYGMLTGALSFVLIFIGSLAIGPGGLDLPHTTIRGIFFSEWKFATFILKVGLPISFLNGAYAWWSARKVNKK